MSSILIKTESRAGIEGAIMAFATHILVDGIEQKMVKALRVNFPQGDAIRVEIEVYPTVLEIQGEAVVQRIIVCPKCEQKMNAEAFGS